MELLDGVVYGRDTLGHALPVTLYGTHKHPNVQAWLKKHPRFVSHFVPTSSSWLNLVERWFGDLTSKRIRRGVFLAIRSMWRRCGAQGSGSLSCIRGRADRAASAAEGACGLTRS